MNRPTRADSQLAALVRADYESLLRNASPALLERGLALLKQVPADRWTIEWFLPRWLGDSLELLSDVSRALVLSNVLGMTFVRLADDLADGATQGSTRAMDIALAELLERQWVLSYNPYFAPDSDFWPLLRRHRSAWISATFAHDRDARNPADRGAPLHVSAAAACLLAGHSDFIPACGQGINSYLIAAVLLDDFKDWREDLGAGRQNSFANYACGYLGRDGDVEKARRAIMRELHVGQAGRPYFDSICAHLREARRCAAQVNCGRWADYLGEYERGIKQLTRETARASAARLRSATAQLVGE